jgi:putative transposase
MILELLLDEEGKAMVGARRLERIGSRKDQRIGSYLHRLVTSMGADRRRDATHAPERLAGRRDRPLQATARRTRRHDRAGLRAGRVHPRHGTRRRKPAGNTYSRSTVSRVTKTLEQQIEELRGKPLAEPLPYLYLDANVLDARWARSGENVSALVARSEPRSRRRAGASCCRSCATAGSPESSS